MINLQNTLGAVFFIVLFFGATLLATVDSFEPLTAYIMSPPAFLIVLSFAGFTYIKKININLMTWALFLSRIWSLVVGWAF